MQNNRIPLLLAALVVLLGVAWLAGVFESDPSTVEVPEIDIDPERIEAFAVVGPDVDVRLARQDGAWQLMAPVSGPADASTVADVLEDLSTLELGTVVSTSAERYGRYGVDSTALRVEIDGKTLHISERGPDLRSTYVRISGDERVYSTRNRASIPRALDRWRDKTLVDLSERSIAVASVSGPDADYEVSRTERGWTVAPSGGEAVPADSAEVTRWLQRFAPLEADGFYGSLTPDSVRAGQTHVLAFGLADGSTTRVAMSERSDGYAVLAGEDGEVLKIFTSRLGQLVPPMDRLTVD